MARESSMHLIEENEELVAQAMVIVSPAPIERFQRFAESFRADGVSPADEKTVGRLAGPQKVQCLARGMGLRLPNKPDPANPAIVLRFAIEDQWRRVADLGR